MKTCLVVFYSRTGMTRKMADVIAQACGCDLEAIREAHTRAGLFGYLHSGYEVLTKKLPVIEPAIKNPAEYGITVLGTPVWAGNISSPMRSYIMRNKNSFNQVAAFCTMGGSGGDNILDDIGTLCGKHFATRLALTDRQIDGKLYLDHVAAFVKSLEMVP